MRELTQPPVSDFFRPNFWPNTPDILTERLQQGGRAAFIARLVLAATLSSNYGIYGPAFELMEHRPRESGSEEYLNSEKYELKRWDIKRPDSLRDVITRVNRARRTNAALHSNRRLRFHEIDNDQIICYSKQSEDGENIVLVLVNLDSSHAQSGWVRLPLADWGLPSETSYEVADLLTDGTYVWTGERNFAVLDPRVMPAHLLTLRRGGAPRQ